MYEWNKFPYKNPAYDYQGEALGKIWKELHCGDREPFPEDERLCEAWRCYHRGDFQQATEFTPRDAVEKLDVESALAEFE